MPKKLDSFFLMDNTINLMKSLLDNTKRTGLEHGFDLCSNQRERILKAENFCVGDRCGVSNIQRCKKGDILVGGYHTHPSPFTERPSLEDLRLNLQFGIGCIGTVKDNSIKCYVKKGHISFKEELDVIQKMDKLIDKREKNVLTQEDFKEFMKLEDSTKKKYFDIINIL